MKWSQIAGRSLMVLALGWWALILAYFGWMSGAFSATGLFGVTYSAAERMAAWVYVIMAVVLSVIAGLIWRPRAGRLVVAGVVIASAGLVGFGLAEGWGDDLWAALAVYPFMGLGYWLNRR